MSQSTSAPTGNGKHAAHDCPFCAVLSGEAPGTIIARDETLGFAIIKSIHPESTVHWLAMPIAHVDSTEGFEQQAGDRFLQLMEYAVNAAKRATATVPELERGFTLKTHFGSFETVPHAKIHILAME
jgi:histidine triad (HIT) family protein